MFDKQVVVLVKSVKQMQVYFTLINTYKQEGLYLDFPL